LRCRHPPPNPNPPFPNPQSPFLKYNYYKDKLNKFKK